MSNVTDDRYTIPMPFADGVRTSVAAGQISGAVAGMMTRRQLRIEAMGLSDQATGTPTRCDTIFRIGSTAKPLFAAGLLRVLAEREIGFDREIREWIPELAERRVLRDPLAEIDDTVPAAREITIWDLLTYQTGIGIYLGQTSTPIFRAMVAAGVAPTREPVDVGPNEFARRLGTLPLAHQPGETFMYHVSDDIIRILIGRITGRPLHEILREQVFEPLAMVDTGCSVPPGKIDRFSTCYFARRSSGAPLEVWDERGGRFADEPIFPNQLASTVGDYFNFARMLLDDGMFRGRQFLAAETVRLMTTDHLTDEQKRRSPNGGFFDTRGWGFASTVYSRSIENGPRAGSYSWFGGYGPHFLVDKARGSALMLMIPRVVEGSNETRLGYAFELETYRTFLSDENL